MIAITARCTAAFGCLQLLVTAAASWRPGTPVTGSRLKEVLPLGVSFLLAAFTALHALQHVNVDVLVALQACTPIAAALAEWLFLASACQPRGVASGAVVLLSAAAVSPQLGYITRKGLLWLGCFFMSSTFYQTYSTYSANGTKFSTNWQVFHESLIGSALCLVLAMPHLLSITSVRGPAGLLLLVSCAMALAQSYTGWALRKALPSALPYQPHSILAQLLSVGLNLVVWGKHGSGMATTVLVGAVSLTSLIRTQTSQQATAALHASSSSGSSNSSVDGVNDDQFESKDKKLQRNPLQFWWGLVATATAVGALLWLLSAAMAAALHSSDPSLARARHQVEQEMRVVEQELQQLGAKAQQWEKQLESKVMDHNPLLGPRHATAGNATTPMFTLTSTILTEPGAHNGSGGSNSGDEYLARLRAVAKKPIRVVIMTALYWSIHPSLWQNCSLDGVPLNCDFTMDKSEANIRAADCLYYHIPAFASSPHAKAFPNQLRLAMSLESATYYKALADPHVMCQYDAEMSYRHCAQVINWYSLEGLDEMFELPLVPFEEKLHAIVYINRNCNPPSRRGEIIRELMALKGKVPVHAVSGCEHNKDWPPGNPSKRQVQSRYKFCVTMENSLAYDYVTEKVWDGLAAGCVPVYMGSSSALDMIPDRRGIILYDPAGKGNASTPTELDALMHEIGSDKARYEAMVAWKHKKPEEQPSELFKQLWKVRHTTGECFLCQFLARHRMNPKPKYTTCMFNETWMAAANQPIVPQPGCNEVNAG